MQLLIDAAAWIWDIGASWKAKHVWNPWTVGNQTAGYLTQFDVPTSKTGGRGSFSLVTVSLKDVRCSAYLTFGFAFAHFFSIFA
jgi:hypothetical protein